MALFVDAIDRLRGRTPSYDWRYMPAVREGSIDLADGLSASYSAIYRKQPYVYAAVNKLAKSVARMPLKAYQRDGEDRTRLYDGALYRLTTRPGYRVTPLAFVDRIIKNVAIYGNAIVVKLGATAEDAVPDDLMLAPAIGWSVGEGDTYVWTSRDGQQYPFQRWQLIHFRFWDLDECGFGMSMLEPLRMTLALEDAAQRYGVAAFRNGAKPGSVLTTPNALKKEGIEAARAELMAIHGSVDNAFKVMILQQGLQYATIEHDLAKAAVVEHRKLTRDEVASVFDVPGSTIGINDEANFASVDAFHVALYQDSLGPWVSMIEQTFQAEFVDLIPAFVNQYVEFDLNAVLRGDIESRYRAYATAITTGFKTPNEIRKLENDPPSTQEGASQLLFPMNLSGAVGSQLAVDTGAKAISLNGASHGA